jgi:TetR/AcrR family tetracycline transcriptional repressor
MARPTTPLISRHTTVQAALDLIDSEGIENFSLRRLGSKLGVHGMSIYHHFRDKDEILDEVASLVLSEVRVTPAPSPDIVGWSVANAKRYRRALLKHPNAMPLFVKRHPVSNRARMYVHEFEALAGLGISQQYWIIILETIEAFVLGAAIFLRPGAAASHLSAHNESVVMSAIRANTMDYEDAFELALRPFITSLYDLYRRMSNR